MLWAVSRLHTLLQKNINETHLQSIKSLINILLRTRNSFLGHHRSIEWRIDVVAAAKAVATANSMYKTIIIKDDASMG